MSSDQETNYDEEFEMLSDQWKLDYFKRFYQNEAEWVYGRAAGMKGHELESEYGLTEQDEVVAFISGSLDWMIDFVQETIRENEKKDKEERKRKEGETPKKEEEDAKRQKTTEARKEQ